MPFDGKAIPTPIADGLRHFLPDESKWCKYTGYKHDTGQRCLIGALLGKGAWDSERLACIPLLNKAILAIDPDAPAKAKREYMINPRSEFVALWNNAAETTFADVERAIDALAEIERQRALVNA